MIGYSITAKTSGARILATAGRPPQAGKFDANGTGGERAAQRVRRPVRPQPRRRRLRRHYRPVGIRQKPVSSHDRRPRSQRRQGLAERDGANFHRRAGMAKKGDLCLRRIRLVGRHCDRALRAKHAKRGHWPGRPSWASRRSSRCIDRAAIHRREATPGAGQGTAAVPARFASGRTDRPAGRGVGHQGRGAASRTNDRRDIHPAGDPRCQPGRAPGGSALSNGGRTAGSAMNPILLTPLDISIAASLIILDPVLSLWLKLRLHRQIAIAAARMFVQLVAIGYVPLFIFALNNPAATLLLVLVMVLVAAREVAARPERRFKDQSNLVIGFVSVGVATFVTAILALTTAIRPQPWFDPHYAIPLPGIILRHLLNSASLSLHSFLGSVRRERPAIEARLSLGESYREAIAPLVREAIRRALLPIINQMSAAGIVTLPGIMTGQILTGLHPLEAVQYQILLMFLLSGGSGLSALAASYLAAWRLPDDRQQLRRARRQ